MKILLVHNQYLQPGGEDEVVNAEKRLLEDEGNQVISYERSNREINQKNFLEKVNYVLRDACWSKRTYDDVKQLIKENKPDVAHIHNTFYVISPSVYDICHDENIPIVQTLHNYRPLCPIGTFYRDGRVCEDCLKDGSKSAVIHRCWKNSYTASAFLINILKRYKKTDEKISHYIALSNFSRKKFIQNGFPEDKVSVKPNFSEFNPGAYPQQKEKYGLFIGGFSPYKGIKTLLDAWKEIKDGYTLKVIGDGPLFDQYSNNYKGLNVEFLGRKPLEDTMNHLRKAKFLIVPSECYENFPRVIAEAYAMKVPVIASNLGAMAELIIDRSTGLLFEPGNSKDLSGKINILINDDNLAQKYGVNAGQEYAKYERKKNYESLMRVYKKVL